MLGLHWTSTVRMKFHPTACWGLSTKTKQTTCELPEGAGQDQWSWKPRRQGEMGDGEFPLFLGCLWCWWALAVVEVGMKMENTWILGIVKLTVPVIASAMAVNHHRVLYLTLTLSKSGILVLSCPHNVLTFCFWQLHFPAPYRVSLIQWVWYHILLNTLKARPLICWTQFSLLFFRRHRHPVINASNPG